MNYSWFIVVTLLINLSFNNKPGEHFNLRKLQACKLPSWKAQERFFLLDSNTFKFFEHHIVHDVEFIVWENSFESPRKSTTSSSASKVYL